MSNWIIDDLLGGRLLPVSADERRAEINKLIAQYKNSKDFNAGTLLANYPYTLEKAKEILAKERAKQAAKAARILAKTKPEKKSRKRRMPKIDFIEEDLIPERKMKLRKRKKHPKIKITETDYISD